MNKKKFTDNQILEAYNNASEDIQKIVTDKQLGPVVLSIGKKYGIPSVQCVELANEVIYILLGLSSPENIEQRIRESFLVPEEIAKRIAKELREEIPFEKLLGGGKIYTPEESIKKEPLDTPKDTTKTTQTSRQVSINTPRQDTPSVARAQSTPPTPPPAPPAMVKGGEEKEQQSSTTTTPPTEPVHIFEQKLNEAASTPTPQPASEAPAQRTPGNDPYREPIE